MKAPREEHGFWAGGHCEYIRTLGEQERQLLAPLEARLKKGAEDKERIAAEIAGIKESFAKKRRDSEASHF